MEIDENPGFTVRLSKADDWEEAMGLAWKTFLRFEAQDYSQEGIRSFNDFITDTMLHRLFLNGLYQMFVAEGESGLIGMITLRGENHISLLFVDEKFHKQGVGRRLMETLCGYLRDEMGKEQVTVNSSPYGVGFYHKLGFVDLGPEITRDGISYTPMMRVLEKI